MVEPGRKIKILLITPHANLGGASKVLINMIQSLYPSNSLEFFFLFKWKGSEIDTYRQFGEVFQLPLDQIPLIKKLLYKISSKLGDYAYSWLFRAVTNRIKPDLLYFNYVTEDPFSREATKLSIPSIWHLHELGISLSTLSKEWVQTFTTKASLLLACSNATAGYYANHFQVDRSKLRVLYSPPSFNLLQKNTSKVDFPGAYPRETIKIGVAATFSYVKGPDTFIKAASIVQKQHANVAFFWIGISSVQLSGNDPFFEECIKLKDDLGLDNFHFLNETHHIGSFYEGIDILAIPSRTEGLPLSMQEAMLFRKPVVAMNVGGISEILTDQTGYLVVQQRPEAFAEALMYFVKNQKERITSGENGYNWVMRYSEASTIAPQWVALLKEIYESAG